MTGPERDDFDAYLQRRPVLPRLDDELEPPAALDRKVLAEARGGIGPLQPPQQQQQPQRPANRPPRWVVPIALAATILLCLSVVINISLNTNRPAPGRDRFAAARADLKASAKANATAESDAAAGVAARDKAPAMAFGEDEHRESVPGGIPSNEVVLPGAKVAGAAAPRAPVEVERVATAAASKAPTSVAPAEVAPAEGAPAEGAPALAPPTSGGPALAARAPAAPAHAAEAEPHQPALTDALSVPSGEAFSDSRMARSESAEEKARQFRKEAIANEPVAKLADATTKDAPHAHPTDPKVWLRQIDALRAAGKTEQAAAELRRFKAAFPGYAVSAPPPGPATLPK